MKLRGRVMSLARRGCPQRASDSGSARPADHDERSGGPSGHREPCDPIRSPSDSREDPSMLRRVILPLAILVMLPSAASADFSYYGTHMGFAQGAHQMVVGGQLQYNGIAPRLAFVPGLDYGFGNQRSVLTLN